jgi:hypothetical protein
MGSVPPTLLQHPKHLRLGHEAHVRDLVQEDRAAVGQLELAALLRRGARERTLFVAEQLGLDQLLRNGRAVHFHKGPARAPALQVDLTRHQLLAGSVVAGDQNPAVGRRCHLDLLLELRDRLGFAEDLVGVQRLSPQSLVLVLEARLIQRVLNRQKQLVDRERLLDEVEGTDARGADGRLDRSVTAHHHDREPRPALAQLAQDLDPVAVRHRDVEEHQIRRPFPLDGRDGLVSVGLRSGVEALVREDSAERATDALLVVDDQDAGHRLRPLEPGAR